MHRSATWTLALALSLGLTLLHSLPAPAQTPPPPATPGAPEGAKPEKPAVGIVKLDITEKLDGRDFRDTAATLKIRKQLRALGYKVTTAKPLYADEYQRRKEQGAAGGSAGASGAAKGAGDAKADPKSAPAEDESKLVPDIVVKGTVVYKLDRTSTFFGGTVGVMYLGTAELELQDAQGKSLGKITDRDEWGRTKEDEARKDCIVRMASFLAAAVVNAAPVLARLDDGGKAAAKAYGEKIAKDHPRMQPESGKPGEGAPPAGEKKDGAEGAKTEGGK